MTEYGVLLGDGTVAPAASRTAALAYALGYRRRVVYRQPRRDWHVVPLSTVRTWSVEKSAPADDCPVPGHAARWRHERRGEKLCAGCRSWDAGYRRELRRRVVGVAA